MTMKKHQRGAACAEPSEAADGSQGKEKMHTEESQAAQANKSVKQ